MPDLEEPMAESRRAFAIEIEMGATPEEVWRALTEPAELVRWFPLEAEVAPGPGGRVVWSWGGDWRWESAIEAWEPGRRLLLGQLAERPFDAEGRPLAAGTVEAAKIAMEFTLDRAGGGATRLRLVHSGFGRGAAWDDELDGISHGWTCELRGLAHYLERHRGRDRFVGRAYTSSALPPEELFDRLLGPAGFQLAPPAPAPGAAYEVEGAGVRFRGEVLVTAPRRQFAGSARELGDGIFRIDTWRGGGTTGAMVWAESWREADAPRLAAFEQAAARLLAELAPRPG
jgi:uncharacterized protein YndB with AHSA1/START domain